MAEYIRFTSPALCAKCGLERRTWGYAVTKRVNPFSVMEFTVEVPLCARCRERLLIRDRLARRVGQGALAVFIVTICLSVVLVGHSLIGVVFPILVVTGAASRFHRSGHPVTVALPAAPIRATIVKSAYEPGPVTTCCRRAGSPSERLMCPPDRLNDLCRK
jgi:hypothetical protein